MFLQLLTLSSAFIPQEQRIVRNPLKSICNNNTVIVLSSFGPGACEADQQQPCDGDQRRDGLREDHAGDAVHPGWSHRARPGLHVQDRVHPAPQDQRHLRECPFPCALAPRTRAFRVPSRAPQSLLQITILLMCTNWIFAGSGRWWSTGTAALFFPGVSHGLYLWF